MNIRKNYIRIAIVTLLVAGLLPLAVSTANACDYSNCEPRTPGFWKNHPDDWPVNMITIGGVKYTKDQAIQIMQTPGKGDKEQLVKEKVGDPHRQQRNKERPSISATSWQSLSF